MTIRQSIRSTGLAVLMCVTALAGGTVAVPVARGVSTAGVNTMTVNQEDGNGSGSSDLWRDGTDQLTVEFIDTGIRITARHGQDSQAPATTFFFTSTPYSYPPLTVGHYDDTGSRIDPGPSLSTECSSRPGWFDILDLPADHSRLWLVYGQQCDSYATGEVRYGEPADPELLVAPTRAVFAPRFAGIAGRAIPITLVNTGPALLTVTGATFSGPAAADYSVGGLGSCLAVPAGGTCTVDVSLTANGDGDRSAELLLADSSATGRHAVQLDGTAMSTADAGWSRGASVGPVQVAPGDQHVEVSWVNPTTPSWVRTVIRGTKGLGPALDENDGFPVYSGRGTTTDYGSTTPAQPYTFTAFAEFKDGSIAKDFVRFNAVVIVLNVDHIQVAYGGAMTVSGQIWDPEDVKLLQGAPLTLTGRANYGDPATTVATTNAGTNGTFHFHLTPKRTLIYEVVYAGDPQHAHAISNDVLTRVTATVTAKPAHASVRHGKPDAIAFTAAPAANKASVQLQQYRSGRWVKVSTVRSDAHGRGTFTVKPATKGTYKYRVRYPARSGAEEGYSKTLTVRAT